MNRPNRMRLILGLILMALAPVSAVPIGDLPGEEINTTPSASEAPETLPESPAPAVNPTHWLASGIEEQLSRDRTLLPMGKGAVFLPTFTEPRREPEITLLNSRGKEEQNGQTGERIILDSGTYTVRFGSGTSGQQMTMPVKITEGHTLVKPPDWSGLLVETLLPTGEYIDAQYEVIRIGKWINYGKGHGLKEERLQDIKTWILPAGLYRISKPGEGFASLRNFITVQLNPGELKRVELIFDKTGGETIAGGIKTLNARSRVGSYWTYGVRAGGNVNLIRVTEEGGLRKESMQVSSDARLQVLFDNARYLGSSELVLQDYFSKAKGKPFEVTSDLANLRTNWVRRINQWLGPYVRASVESHIFPRNAERDTIYIINKRVVADSVAYDTVLTPGSNDKEVRPVLDPLKLAEGAGVNIEFLSRYYLEVNTQIGLAGRQGLAFQSYIANNDSTYTRDVSNYEIGIENTLNALVRLGSQATLDLRTEIFAPNGNFSRLKLDDITADLRFFLSRNLEVGYIYHVNEISGKVKNHYPSTHNLSLRISFNF